MHKNLGIERKNDAGRECEQQQTSTNQSQALINRRSSTPDGAGKQPTEYVIIKSAVHVATAAYIESILMLE